MPQFDVSSFSSQLFWLAIVFAILYFIVSKFIAPKAESILTARNRYIEDDINYAEVYKKEAKMNPWYFPSIGEYSTELEKVGFKVSYAEHYDRPTKLADKETGIMDWIMMFGKVFFANVSKDDIEEIAQEVQSDLQSKLFYDDNWFADYKRIRIIAKK